jgi:hypothetical protein
MQKNYYYYTEALEMVVRVKLFIINVINKELQYVYIRMKKDLFLEDIIRYLGVIEGIG